jgi:hypothetical protein
MYLVNIRANHTEQHSVLNGLKDYGYVGIDDSSKVRHLLKGIKTTELYVCKTPLMVSPSLCDDLRLVRSFHVFLGFDRFEISMH